MSRDVRSLLRSLPVLTHPAPGVDTTRLPQDPQVLFRTWLEQAVAADAVEPHAMVLSTVGADGMPDARALLLKDLREDAWWFATDTSSVKARQLAVHPAAALTFYWPTLGRQVRVRGVVRVGTDEENVRDHVERAAAARAAVVVAASGQPGRSRDEFAARVRDTLPDVARDPTLGARAWRTYGVVAHQVEFWEADPARLHLRVRYSRRSTGEVWRHTVLTH